MSNRPSKLAVSDVEKALESLSGWIYDAADEAIKKTFTFEDFNEAFGFMARAAIYADKNDHHPEWFNVYNRVEVKMTTHDADGVTQLDLDTAAFMNSVVG